MSGWRRCNSHARLPLSTCPSMRVGARQQYDIITSRSMPGSTRPCSCSSTSSRSVKSEGGNWPACQLERLSIPKNERWRRIDGGAGGIESPRNSVHAAEILPLLRQQFEIVEQLDYGDSVLHKLQYIVGNFDSDRPEDVALLWLLCAAKQALIQTGALQSDFTLLAARNIKRSPRRSQLPFDAAIERHIVSGVYPVEHAPAEQAFCWIAPGAESVLARPSAHVRCASCRACHLYRSV